MSDPSEPIVVVSGLPRSGTSLMMQMLEAGGVGVLTDGVRARDEDNPRGYYELEAVKRTRTDASWLDGARGCAVKMVHVLLHDLPTDRAYLVVFMTRELGEVVRSQRVMLDRLGTPGPAIGADQLEAMYEQQYAMTRSWLEEAAHCRSLIVSFNELVAEPTRLADVVASFVGSGLGRRLDVQAMAGCVDPGLYRQRG